jgi:glycosyltransferase involved in cell wall biosynthesis
VRHEESGLVVDPTPTDLARAFRRLIDDRDLAARLGTAGRLVADGLTWPATVKRLLL